jgi:tetratricopeptide (TPR) repeat protein
MERVFIKTHRNIYRRLTGLLLVFLLLLPLPIFSQTPDTTQTPDDQTMSELSIAYSKHEIIQLLMQKGDYETAFTEFEKILALRIPSEYEDALFKEIIIVSRKFYELDQKEFAYSSLDLGFDRLSQAELKAKLLNIKASLLKKDGKLDEAIQTYKNEIMLREKSIKE